MATIHTISFKTARQYINDFRKFPAYQSYFTPPEEEGTPRGAKAFTMDAKELLNAAQQIVNAQEANTSININAVRFYLGTRMEWVRIDPNEPAEYIPVNCLVMVPVKDYVDAELEVQTVGDGSRQIVLTEWPKAGADFDTSILTQSTPEESLCYDFTYPCPPTCPLEQNYLPAPPVA